jgi:hypothetical protein
MALTISHTPTLVYFSSFPILNYEFVVKQGSYEYVFDVFGLFKTFNQTIRTDITARLEQRSLAAD